MSLIVWIWKKTRDNPFAFVEALSAVVIAVTAVVGYYFTVVPIYSKAVLEEEKAKLEQSLAALRSQTETLQGERRRLDAEKYDASNLIDRLRVQLGNLEAEYAKQKADLDAQKSEMVKTAAESLSVINRLDEDRRRISNDVARLLDERGRFEADVREYHVVTRRFTIDRYLRRVRTQAEFAWGNWAILYSTRKLEDFKKLGDTTKKKLEAFGLTASPYRDPHDPETEQDLFMTFFNVQKTGREILEDGLTIPEFSLLRQRDQEILIEQIRAFMTSYQDVPALDEPLLRTFPATMTEAQFNVESARHRRAHERFKTALDSLRAHLVGT